MNTLAPSPLLDVRDLCVEFSIGPGATRALDGVSFTVMPGEILGLVGESGAGKSLTGAAIIGLIEPPGRMSQGEIRWEGRRIDGLPERALRRLRGRRIGAIFQDPSTSLDPIQTIGRQLIETLRTHFPLSRAEARAKAIDLLRQTGMAAAEQRLDQYPHQLSGGLRQRVVIALALAAEPALIIADEPTTALDVSIQAQIIDLLRSLARERRTAVMLITHDMGVIAQACDRVAVMYAGRVVEIGSVRSIIDTPSHPYTRGLIGAIPPLDQDRDRLLQIDGAMPRPGGAPAGCAFHPRCPQAMPACTRERPALQAVGAAQVACWLSSAAAAQAEGAA